MSFHVLDAAYDLLRAVRTPLATVKAANGPLGDQLIRAVSSVPLNIAEGSAHKAKSRAHHYRIAHGSAREVEAALRTAEALRYVDMADIATALHYADRLHALLYMLIHPRSKR